MTSSNGLPPATRCPRRARQGSDLYGMDLSRTKRVDLLRDVYARFRVLIHEVAKFGTVGILAFLITIVSAENVLRSGAGLGPLTSVTIATIVATVFHFLDRQLTFMLPPVPQIEDFIMAETFRNIREKGLKLESSEGKILTSFEIDLSRFADTLIKIQSFIEDINSDKDVFSDSKLDFDKAEVNKLWHFDFLIQFSYILGDDSFRRNLENFLKSFSKNQKFYDLTQVNSELFNRFVKTLEQNKDP